MAKKIEVTPGVKAQIEHDLAVCSSREERIDIRLSHYRAGQTERDRGAARMAYVKNDVVALMEELGLDDRVTETRGSRTIGILSWPAKALSSAAQARRIRRLAKPYLTPDELKELVKPTRKTTWSFSPRTLKKLPEHIREKIGEVRGYGTPTIDVRSATKKARRGERGR